MRTKDYIADNPDLAAEQRANKTLQRRSGLAETVSPVDPDYFVMLDVNEVSAMVRLSPRTIRRRIFDCTFPDDVRPSPGRQLWRKSEVLQFLGGRRDWPPF